jgi:hypothetical protein
MRRCFHLALGGSSWAARKLPTRTRQHLTVACPSSASAAPPRWGRVRSLVDFSPSLGGGVPWDCRAERAGVLSRTQRVRSTWGLETRAGPTDSHSTTSRAYLLRSLIKLFLLLLLLLLLQAHSKLSGEKEGRDVYYGVGRRPEKLVKKVEKLREAKATTLRRVRLARSCAIGGGGRCGRG